MFIVQLICWNSKFLAIFHGPRTRSARPPYGGKRAIPNWLRSIFQYFGDFPWSSRKNWKMSLISIRYILISLFEHRNKKFSTLKIFPPLNRLFWPSRALKYKIHNKIYSARVFTECVRSKSRGVSRDAAAHHVICQEEEEQQALY